MVVYYASSSGKDELYHHGIKGMHWHDRRFQNPDGSLTPAGRIRYGVGKAAAVAKAGLGKAGHAVAGAVKAKVEANRVAKRAKAVSKMTATKSDLAKNYDKLTPEERKEALEKFKFQDDLADSVKKDWQRKVEYAKIAFDAIDTGKKIGDDLSKIMTGKDLTELAKSRNKDPNEKDKDYWDKELKKGQALLAQENAEKQRLLNKAQNDGDVDTYSSGARDKLNRDAAEKAAAEKKQKREEAIQKFNDVLVKGADAVESGANAVKQKASDAADKAKDKYNQVAPKVADKAKDIYNTTGEAVGKAGTVVYKKVNETAPKVKDAAVGAAKDVYNYTGEAAGKAGKKVYDTVNDVYNRSGEAVGKAGTKVYNAVNEAAAKGKEAAVKGKEAANAAANLTKAKATALYKSAGSAAAAAKKAGCSPSTISKFLGNIGKPKNTASMKMRIKIVSPEEYEKHGRSNNVDDYTKDRLQRNQEMIDHGMDIIDDILRHSAVEDDELAHFGVKGMKWYQHVAAKTGPSAHSVTSASQRVEKATSKISTGGGGGGFVEDPTEIEHEIKEAENEISKLEESIRRLGAVPGQEGVIEMLRASIAMKKTEIAEKKKRASDLKAISDAQAESMRHSFDDDEVASLFAGATFFV